MKRFFPGDPDIPLYDLPGWELPGRRKRLNGR
jgi:hypothetical protein